jgi:hypothetical protein
VGRGTIERLESGDDRISVGTVLHVLKVLGASPCYYYDLAMQPTKTLGEIHAQRAIVRGIVTYVRVLAERKHVGPTALDDFAYSPLMIGANGTGDVNAISTYAILLALIYLEAPLADLAPIVRAASNHESIGRQLAEQRGAFTGQLDQVQSHEQPERHSIPAIDATLYRVSTILRYSQGLPTVLKHELSRVEADLRRYRALLSLAVGYIKAEP